MKRKINKKLRIILFFILLATILSLSFLFLTLSITSHKIDALKKYSQNSANQLNLLLVSNTNKGIVRTVGLSNLTVKKLMAGDLEVDDRSVLISLGEIKNFYRGSIVYLMDTSGTVIACTPYGENKTLTGRNYSFRPYFKNALEGKDATYLTLGVTTHKRGVYYAAPITAHPDSIRNPNYKKIIGVVVIKMPLRRINFFLKGLSMPAALVSPKGNIFASNMSDWIFENFDLSLNKDLYLKKKKYAVEVQTLSLEENGKRWKLIIFQNREEWYPYWLYFLVATVILIFISLVGVALYLNFKYKRSKEKLFQSEKLNALGQLAGGIAHDFNNYLATIIGFAELVHSEVKENESVKLSSIEKILKASNHSKDLIQKLLSFASKGKKQIVSVDIHKLIDEVISFLGHSLDKRIKITTSFKAKEFLVNGDVTQLQNALLNIAINSRDAMPEGGDIIFSTDVISIDSGYLNSHHHKTLPGRYIQISVADTGCGIEKETLKHVFEPFYTTKSNNKGTGLGLASVYGIVKEHEGMVDVYSEHKIGTTVKIYLPCCNNKVEKNEVKQNKKRLQKISNLRILIVDDEEDVLEMTEAILKKLGHKVEPFLSSSLALERYRTSWKEFDLILLDTVMPEINGPELFYRMKEINPETVAILTSGFTFNQQIQDVLDKGVKAFLQKPYGLSSLSKIIDKVKEN